MTRFSLGILAAVSLTALQGCTMMAPAYTPSIANVQTLKDQPFQGAKVGSFTGASASGSGMGSISLRGSSLISPTGNYASYLGSALTQELTMAGKLNPASDIEISGTLIQNDIDISSSMSTGTGNIQARILVNKGSQTRFDKVVQTTTTFPSSFMGSVAIPNGQQEYPHLVQQLLTVLYADNAFMQALK